MVLQRVTWSTARIMKLLEMVKQRPSVWQIDHKLYRDRQEKAKAFQEMGACLSVPGAEVKRKLHNLRCTYRRLIRRPTQKKNAKGNAALIRWKFYAPMQFLYVNTRYAGTAVGTVPMVKNEVILSDDDDYSKTTDADLSYAYKEDPLSSQESNANTPTYLATAESSLGFAAYPPVAPELQQHENFPPTSNGFGSARKRDDYFVDPYQRYVSPRDEYAIFGEYIACKLRNMPNDIRLATEQKITKVIFKSVRSVEKRKRIPTTVTPSSTMSYDQ